MFEKVWDCTRGNPAFIEVCGISCVCTKEYSMIIMNIIANKIE